MGRVPSQKNVSLRGAGVDLPECQERRRGKHKSTKKVSVFFLGVKASPARGRRRLQKNTPPPPGVVLDIGEGQLSQTFGGRGRLRLTFFGGGGGG